MAIVSPTSSPNTSHTGSGDVGGLEGMHEQGSWGWSEEERAPRHSLLRALLNLKLALDRILTVTKNQLI